MSDRSLTDFAPLRAHAAAIALCSRLTTWDLAWGGDSPKMNQNCVDTRVRIQIQGRSTIEKSTLTRFPGCRRKNHSGRTPSNEKEIHFPISILQIPSPDRRFVLLRGDNARSVCAATHAVGPVEQSTAGRPRPISWRDAGG